MILLIISLFLTTAFCIVLVLRNKKTYWKKYNVPQIPPNLLTGNLTDLCLLKTSCAEYFQKLYCHEEAKNEAVVGIYFINTPVLIIRDPELIKLILIKDFSKFSNRSVSMDPHVDPLGSYNLFLLKNPFWRELRAKLTPVFTSGKMKQYFVLTNEVGVKLDKHVCKLTEHSKNNEVVLELKELCAVFTTDVIATVAFGVQANSIDNPDGEFRTNGREIVKFDYKRGIELFCIFFKPGLAKRCNFKIFSQKCTTFMRESINYVVNERINSGTVRNDLIDVLVEFKKAAQNDKAHFALNNDFLVAQAAIFFTAGFETTSSTMSFALYELSKNPIIQKRLRQEIKNTLVRNNNTLSYDVLNEMHYLNMVLEEVLRMYPILPFLDRECTLSEDDEAYSLKPYSDFSIPHGMAVFIPVYGIHMDPQYFPDPYKFDPERFSPENVSKILPFTYMPFGVGPHVCIGQRFALMQVKIGLVNFLKNHYVTSCEKSMTTMILNPKSLPLQSLEGIYCNVVRNPLL